jgi:serine/threonine-protein kinase
LTGRPPFDHVHPLDTLVDVIEGEPSLPTRINPAVPRALELIAMHCLEKEPADRYPSAAALADDLERYLREEPVEAQPFGLWQRAQRWVRREPALASRVIGLGVAAAIVQGYYMLSGSDLGFHLLVMSVFAAWAIVSFVFQMMLPEERFAGLVRFAWVTADAISLTTLLCMAAGDISPLLIGYGLLIVASGLFFRVNLVWFTTLACVISYGVLLLVRAEVADPWHYPLIFAGGLAVLGFMVAYQVQRVRALSRYYEHRPLG